MKVRSVFRDWKVSIVFSILFAAWVFTSPLLTTAADDNGISEKNYSNYEKLEQIASSKGKVKVIVKLKVAEIQKLTAESRRFCTPAPGLKSRWAGANADMALMDAITFAADNVLYNLGGTQFRLNHIYASIPYMALEVSAAGLAILQDLPEVLAIEEDIPMKLIDPVRGRSGAKGKANISSPSDLSHPMLGNTVSVIGADAAWSMGYTGSGWYVAVLDSGIRQTHQFFQGKTIVEACFALGSDGLGDCPDGNTTMTGSGSAVHHPSTYNGYDHGTHVAGIAAGNNGSLFGVAKDANIIAVQVFSRFPAAYPLCEGTPCVLCFNSDTLAGLDYIYSIRESYSIASVNMSLGGGEYTSACDGDSRKAAIDNLRAVGIATVISTGNEGHCGAVGAPACISSAVSVGASTDDDIECGFNNWHATMQKLFAPGHQVYSSTGATNSSYDSWDGTSMAAPHVAGAWALLKQVKPTGTVSDFLSVLQSTGVPIETGCFGNNPTIPRIQVDAAIGELTEITLTSPNGGETWALGSTQVITWDSTGLTGNVKLVLFKDGALLGTIENNIPISPGSYPWEIGPLPNGTPVQLGPGYMIRVKSMEDKSYYDDSDGSFTIADITLTSPIGGESWKHGSSQNITWTSGGLTGNVKLVLFKNGTRIGTIATGIPVSPGSYEWTVGDYIGGTASPGTGYVVRVKSIENKTYYDDSNGSFTISEKYITLTSPNGGETWKHGTHGTIEPITWESSGLSGNVKLVLFKDGTRIGTIATGIPVENGSYNWTVGDYIGGTALPGTGYVVRVKSIADKTYFDDSDGSFAISGLVQTSPQNGDIWPLGSTRSVTWVSYGITGNVKIVLFKDGIRIATIAATGIPVLSSSYLWTVGDYIGGTALPGTGYVVRVKSIADKTYFDDTDGSFEISDS